MSTHRLLPKTDEFANVKRVYSFHSYKRNKLQLATLVFHNINFNKKNNKEWIVTITFTEKNIKYIIIPKVKEVIMDIMNIKCTSEMIGTFDHINNKVNYAKGSSQHNIPISNVISINFYVKPNKSELPSLIKSKYPEQQSDMKNGLIGHHTPHHIDMIHTSIKYNDFDNVEQIREEANQQIRKFYKGLEDRDQKREFEKEGNFINLIDD